MQRTMESRFGNQADHFLGSLGFAKHLDRTLILPPWVEYQWPNPKSVQVPFDRYFKPEALQDYHRVITMEKFMKELAPTAREAFYKGGKKNDCNAKDGNPFGPFWDTFNIDFDRSEFYSPLYFDTTNPHELRRWKERYDPKKYPVLAFTGAPAAFPVQQQHVKLHTFLKWSDFIEKQADEFIKDNINGVFVGIHLRRGSDWENACTHVGAGSHMFASPQCLGYNNEYGHVTKELCMPAEESIIKQVKKAVKRTKASTIKFVKQKESNPHVDLAILGKADYYIGNCISSFSAFAKRERDAAGKLSEFWSFKSIHDEL
ncbi:hypothetical protein KUTeg_021413 [Tegillarca granosa]|uniref:GDP-fucose protein O-fucosyltransferase 1 n=1 Tax=Tegillarca granosa TaxID=220873 RepID=A0ABQ9E6F5_TEGGR|nr:hypothetical protein KUTeg_021413 [Tegillarca granosa]